MIYQILYFFLLLSIAHSSNAQSDTNDNLRWKIKSNNAIHWQVDQDTALPHSDNIEMAGQQVAGIVTYSIDEERNLSLSRKVIFPQLHPLIKDSDPSWFVYRAYAQTDITDDEMPQLFSNGKQLSLGKVERVELNGALQIFHTPTQTGLRVMRTLLPATEEAIFLELWSLENITDQALEIRVADCTLHQEDYDANGK
ncbi:MAG: hypothetical protein AB8G22_00745 [Saprospiraceae bacterium]